MGTIKSAMELALEKTADIQSNPQTLGSRKILNAGKKAASEFLIDGNKETLKAALKQYKKEEKDSFVEGAVTILLARIQLPKNEDELTPLGQIGKGLELLIPGKGIESFFKDIHHVFQQYLNTKVQLAEALTRQYMPRIKQKEAELAKRVGHPVQLSPDNDEEFMTLLSRKESALTEQYQQAVTEARSQILSIAGLRD